MSRHRTNREPQLGTTTNEEPTTFLDEVEQDKVVDSLRIEAQQQIKYLNKIFFIVGIALSGLFLSSTFFATEKLQWRLVLHAIHTSLLLLSYPTWYAYEQLLSPRQATGAKRDYLFFAVSVFPVFPLVYVIGFDWTNGTELHWVMITASSFMTFFYMAMKKGALSTMRSLDELESTKYKYKSL